MERTLLCQHLLPSSVISSSSHSIENDLVTKELHLQAKTKHQKDLRKELFGMLALSVTLPISFVYIIKVEVIVTKVSYIEH